MRFLTEGDVLRIHEHQIQVFGGGTGIRDAGLLASAIAQPHSEFGGVVLHEYPFGMAAAYLFHLCANHPFVTVGTDDLYEPTMATARGECDKATIAKTLERLVETSRTAP